MLSRLGILGRFDGFMLINVVDLFWPRLMHSSGLWVTVMLELHNILTGLSEPFKIFYFTAQTVRRIYRFGGSLTIPLLALN